MLPVLLFFLFRRYSCMADQIYNTLPLKPCRRSGCAELVRGGGYCPKHQIKADQVRRSVQPERRESAAYHNLYYSRRWRMLRAEQLIAEPFCRECGRRGIRTRAEDIDHIKPHKGNKRLFFDPSNLQSLCHSCHSRKTIAERSATLPPPENV